MVASYHVLRHGLGRTLDAFSSQLAGAELRRIPGARDVRVFATGPFRVRVGPAFDLHQTAILAAWEDEAAFERALRSRGLRGKVEEGYHLRLTPVKSHSVNGNPDPFAGADGALAADDPVAILTYGKLKLRHTKVFWQSNARVVEHLLGQPGLLMAIGQGDSPTTTSTFSVWRTLKDATRFAYGPGGHQPVVRPARDENWHHTDIFTRFRVEEARGSWRGRDPLGDAALPYAG